MEEPIKVNKYGKMTWVTAQADELRKEHCMCLFCGNFKPKSDDNCKIADSFYAICKENGNAFILTRCASWKSLDS